MDTIIEKRIADLTVAEFETLMRGLMRESMQETVQQVQAMIWELEQQLPDPDEGLTLSAETQARLQALKESGNGNGGTEDLVSIEDVARTLGITL